MKKRSSSFVRVLAVAGCALALGSCNRAEYATLPKTSTYYGEAAPRRAVATPTAEQPAQAAVAAAPVVAAPAAVAAPVISKATKRTALAPEAAAATTVAVAPAPKPTLVQRMLAKKVMKKMDKMLAKVQRKDATAATARIDGNLRTGIVLLLVGLLVGIFSNLIGAIIAIIGVIFIVLWLLDSL